MENNQPLAGMPGFEPGISRLARPSACPTKLDRIPICRAFARVMISLDERRRLLAHPGF